jgi:hypothetical protein
MPESAANEHPHRLPPTNAYIFTADLGPGVAAVDEIESYCREERIPMTVNPLDYWRSNSYRFPVLARMVRTPFDPFYHTASH